MGLRGPNAKPKSKPKEDTQPDSCDNSFVWQNTRLPFWKRVVKFCNTLPITSGKLAGQTMKLRPWQEDFIKGVYGPRKNGKRIVRTALLSLPRKNGKTGLCAALALAHLCGPCAEQRGQVYSAASDRAQASLIFKEMVAIIERIPWMEDRLNIRFFNKLIEDLENGSTYEALSSDARKAHGLSPSFVICDELAQWRGRELYDNLTSGMDARVEPLTITIGTQAADDVNLMSELVDYSLKVQSGEVTDQSFFGVVYAAPEDADPWSEDTWKACNPALGDFKSLEGIRLQAEQAQRIPARQGPFRNLHLNQRIAAESHFLAREEWLACGGERISPDSLYGRPCYAGLDLSSTNDLTALVLFFPEDQCAVLPYFWLPKDDINALEDQSRVPYRTWAKEKYLELTRGRTVDYRFIAHKLTQVTTDFDLKAVAFDRWRIKQLQAILCENGQDVPLVEFGQGFKDMAPAVDELEKLVLDRKLHHGSNPILTWNMANCVTSTDPAGNRKLDKKRSREKIDGAVALAMAVGIAAKAEPEREISADSIFFC